MAGTYACNIFIWTLVVHARDCLDCCWEFGVLGASRHVSGQIQGTVWRSHTSTQYVASSAYGGCWQLALPLPWPLYAGLHSGYPAMWKQVSCHRLQLSGDG